LFIIARGDSTLTKIKIIGDPGQEEKETAIKWLKNSLKKLEIFEPEIYLAFVKDPQELVKIYKKYIKEFETLPPEKSSRWAEMIFGLFHPTAYLGDKNYRKEEVPPIIIVKKGEEISEYDFLDELAHLKEEKKGWYQIRVQAINLLLHVYSGTRDLTWLSLILWLKPKILNFFSNEILCQYGLNNEVLRERKKTLKSWVENKRIFSDKLDEFASLVVEPAFLTTLPPSYPKKTDEKKLEKILINHIRQIGMEAEYRKIKSIISQLESKPSVINIFKTVRQILELAQDYLSK